MKILRWKLFVEIALTNKGASWHFTRPDVQIQALFLVLCFRLRITFRFVVSDVNECNQLSQPCPENSLCENAEGSHFCLCQAGFVMENGKCQGNSGYCSLFKTWYITALLTIIPRARMGSESIADEAEGRMPNGLLTQKP